MIVSALTGYARSGYAQCVNSGGSTYSCSGANAAGQTISGVNNAAVSTVAGFSVNTALGNALTISGDGAISYTDENASPLTSNAAGTDALFIRAEGDVSGGNDGSVTVTTDGALSGAVSRSRPCWRRRRLLEGGRTPGRSRRDCRR